MSKTQRRWTPEDAILRQEVKVLLEDRRVSGQPSSAALDDKGDGDIKQWSEIAKKIPGRSNKDCRKRFYNEVTGGLKKGAWITNEDTELEELVKTYSPSWAKISKILRNRSADRKMNIYLSLIHIRTKLSLQ